MPLPTKVALIYLAAISFISIVITVADKIKAQMGAWRIKESTLLLFSALGGSVAMYMTMQVIRHKTLHKKFMIGIPVIIVLQALLALTLCRYVFKVI